MNRPATIILIIMIWIGLMAWAGPIPAQDSSTGPQSLEKLKDAERQERELLNELEELEVEFAGLEDRLVEIEDQVGRVGAKMATGDKEITALNRSLKSTQKYLSSRLRALYTTRQGGMLQILLKAESIPDLVKRYRYLTLILENDHRSLLDFKEQRAQLVERQEQLSLNRAELEELREQLSRQKKEYGEVKRKKISLLMQVHNKKELYLAMIKRQEESHQKLLKEVAVNSEAADQVEPGEKVTRNWPDFENRKGKIPRPTAGKITDGFGRVPGRFNAYTTRHGVIFAVAPGAEIKAVMDGEVLHVGWLKGFGNIIIVNHGNRYYTLTGGLSGITHKTGQWVHQGEVIGMVPKGSVKDKKDIYFEIRHGGQALDPADWLGPKPVA